MGQYLYACPAIDISPMTFIEESGSVGDIFQFMAFYTLLLPGNLSL
jgi:hypothetical protein